MPKRITYIQHGKKAIRLPVDIFLTLGDIKLALCDEVYYDLSGSVDDEVIKTYCLALTRKRIDEKVARWISINGTKSLNNVMDDAVKNPYFNAVDMIVDRLYPELLK